MTFSRRKFIAQTTLTATGTLLLTPRLLAHNRKKDLILGVQLYSVRDDMKKDPLGTLKQLSAMGYKNVEHAGYADRKFYGYTATEFKKVLGDLGLNMPSGHTVLQAKHFDQTTGDFTDEWKYTVEDAAAVGEHYVISPWLDESLRNNYDELLGFLQLFNKSGELCKKYGMKFGYHNHNFEFQDHLNGTLLYDLILAHTDPSLVIQQMDIGNMYGAGGRALDILKKHPGRFASMHVKDEIKSKNGGEMDDQYESTVLGKGVLPVHEIVDQFRKLGGTTEFIIEQESYQGQSPLDCAKADLEVMKSWGF